MQGYHFEARTRYTRGYQPVEQTRNGEEQSRYDEIEDQKKLPEITMGTFFIEPLEEESPDVKPEINEIMLIKDKEDHWNKILDESIRDEGLNMLLKEIKVEDGEEQPSHTCDQTQEWSANLPRSTRATSDFIGRDGDNQNPSKLTPRDDVHITAYLKEEEAINKNSKWGNTMTILTKTAWEESQNIREKNPDINDNDHSSYTLSINSNDSMYEKITSPSIEPIRQDEEI